MVCFAPDPNKTVTNWQQFIAGAHLISHEVYKYFVYAVDNVHALEHKLFIELLGLLIKAMEHAPAWHCLQASQLPAGPAFLSSLEHTEVLWENNSCMDDLLFFWNVNGGWKSKKSEVVIYTHMDSHLGTKPNFHYIKMQQSMSVVNIIYLCVLLSLGRVLKYLWGNKNLSSLLRKQNQIYLTVRGREYSQS